MTTEAIRTKYTSIYSPYEHKAFRQDLPFEQLRKQSRIDLKMQPLSAADFSSRLWQAANIE
jgi:hypothetical protein